MFYQVFWNLIKADFMNLVKKFESGDLNLDRLNYALITLIPKELDAKLLRPISLLNCSFKMFGKALTNRLIKVADRLISKNQFAFIKGRFILESMVVAHEIIHDIHKNKESGVILKLDYEKAYDRVSWTFLEEMLTSRGFGNTWVRWIIKVVKGGSILLGLMMRTVVTSSLKKALDKEIPCHHSFLIWWQIYSLGCLLKLLGVI
jgi:hypothetical protein